jgi:DNA-binding LacI/PurR family transcriptional regulator
VFAVGVLRAAVHRGLRVGPDLAVCGFDDTPTADVLGLTSVRQPVEEVARAMMAVLAPQLPGAPAEPPRPPATRLFVPELVLRGSTG